MGECCALLIRKLHLVFKGTAVPVASLPPEVIVGDVFWIRGGGNLPPKHHLSGSSVLF